MSELPHRPGPEEEGIPDYADDTSTAFDETDRPRFESPAAIPTDQPQAVEEYGTTPAEAREGESLERRLAREEPDTPTGAPWPEGGGDLVDEVVTEATEAQVARDANVLGAPEGPGPEPGPDAAGGNPAARSATTGRLVEPDQGARPDTEPGVFAADAGEPGYSAEEQAIHALSEDDVSGVELPPEELPGAGAGFEPDDAGGTGATAPER